MGKIRKRSKNRVSHRYQLSQQTHAQSQAKTEEKALRQSHNGTPTTDAPPGANHCSREPPTGCHGRAEIRRAQLDRDIADRDAVAGFQIEPCQQRRIHRGAERAVLLCE